MSRKTNEVGAVPVDSVVGGDGAVDGIGQRVTLDDIQAIAFSSAPLEERRARLAELSNDLNARASADRGDDYGGLIEEIQRLTSELALPNAETATRDSLGMTAADRADTMAPDEVVETYGGTDGEGGEEGVAEPSPSVTNNRNVR